MRATIISLIFLMFAGCATEPTQTYRPRNYDGPAWRIDCESKVGLVDDTYIIRINGQDVIQGKFSDFKDHEEFQGVYEDHTVTASLTKLYSGVQVMVFVDGELAATF